MRADEVAAAFTTPLTAPPYRPTRHWFTHREYLNIVYRTDVEALRRVVPEPLEIDDPLVRFEVMHMGDVDGFGPYTECGQAIPVRFGQQHGEYLHAMYLDHFAGTVSGREHSAYPKAFGSPCLYADNGALVGTLDVGSLRVAVATMEYKSVARSTDEAREWITRPSFMVNIVPGYDGRPRACDLVRTQISEVTVHEAWTGRGRLQLFEHVQAPLADLAVREVVEVSHVLTDLALEPIRPVHDYLSR